LDYRIDVHTGDEFQVLADTFNRMAEQLQASYTNLEQQVEARTQQLARSVADLKIGLFAIFEASPKSFHSRPLCAFDGCVHFEDHTPSAESA